MNIDIRFAYVPRFRRQPNRGLKDRRAHLTLMVFCLAAPILLASATFLLVEKRINIAVRLVIFAFAGQCCGFSPLLYFWFREIDYRAWLRSYNELCR